MRKNNLVVDFGKLNNEILKAYNKGDKNRESIIIGVHEKENNFNDILISFGGHNLYIIPSCFFPFDVNAITEGYLKNNISLNNNLYKCIESENITDYQTVNYDYTKYFDKAGKKLECSIFKCDDFKIGVNAAFLKYFNLDNCTLKAKSRKAPLMIFDKCTDNLLALVLPINFRDEEL